MNQENSFETCDLLILGSTPCGISAATQAVHRNLNTILCTHNAHNETLVEASSEMKKVFEGSVGKRREEFENNFYHYWSQEAKKNGVEISAGLVVEQIRKSKDSFLVILNNGSQVVCRSIVMASEYYSLAISNSLLAPIGLASDYDKPILNKHGESSMEGLYFVGKHMGEESTLQALNKSLVCVDAISRKLKLQDMQLSTQAKKYA